MSHLLKLSLLSAGKKVLDFPAVKCSTSCMQTQTVLCSPSHILSEPLTKTGEVSRISEQKGLGPFLDGFLGFF